MKLIFYSYLVSFVLLCFAIATKDFDMSFKYLIISAAFAIAGALADHNGITPNSD